MVYNRILWAIFPEDPGIKFVPGIGNWLARWFLVVSTNFQTRAGLEVDMFVFVFVLEACGVPFLLRVGILFGLIVGVLGACRG